MREHCDQGGTLFFSTHIMEVAERLCDRIGIIHKGRLIACGTMDELKARNRERAVAREDLPGADRAMKKLLRPRPGRPAGQLRAVGPAPPLSSREKKDLWILPLVGARPSSAWRPSSIYYLKLPALVYGLLPPLGQQAALLTFALLTGQFLILVFGFYYVISAFYFSRDLEILIPLPVDAVPGPAVQIHRHPGQRIPDGLPRSSCRCSSPTASWPRRGPGYWVEAVVRLSPAAGHPAGRRLPARRRPDAARQRRPQEGRPDHRPAACS